MARNLHARRKLSELYRRGVEVRFGPDGAKFGRVNEPGKNEPGFDDPLGEDEIAVWVGPPSPLQRDQAMRDAQAAKARALIKAKRDEDSEEHLTVMAFLAEMSLATLVDYVLEAERDERQQDAVREVLAEDEWKDITELQDALRQFDEADTSENDPEYAAVIERDEAYGTQVAARTLELTVAARQAFAMVSRENLEKRALDKRSELVGAHRFMQEFELQMTFYAARDVTNHALLFFESAIDFAEQEDVIQDAIKKALALFINDGAEAKNSPGAVSGSDSSAPPSEPEITESSIPETANA